MKHNQIRMAMYLIFMSLGLNLSSATVWAEETEVSTEITAESDGVEANAEEETETSGETIAENSAEVKENEAESDVAEANAENETALLEAAAATSLKITTQPTDYTGAVGSKATFTVAAEGDGLSYQWQYSDDNGAGWTDSTSASGRTATYSLTLTVARNGRKVRCVVTDTYGSSVMSSEATMTLASSSALTITGQPEDYTGTVGSKAVFTITAEGDGLSYQWQYSDNSGASWTDSTAASGTTAAYSLTLTSARDGRRVRCVLIDTYGNCVVSDEAVMKVETAASVVAITSQPTDYTGAAGSKASFTIGAESTDGTSLSYQWQYSDDGGSNWVTSTAASGTTASYTLTMTVARDGRKVRCIVTDVYGNSVTSDEAEMILDTDDSSAITITTQPIDYEGTIGSRATFTIVAESTNGSKLSYQWQYSDDNGSIWEESTASSGKTAEYSLTMTLARVGRIVRCIVTDENGGRVVSESVTMTYDPTIYTADAFGFFQYIVDTATADGDTTQANSAQAALNILNLETVTYNGETIDNPIKKGIASAATSLTNMQASVAYINECNALRTNEENQLSELKVNYVLTAMAMLNLDFGSDYGTHLSYFNVGENLAYASYRSYDPFTGWYDKEKALYESGTTTYSSIGHYLNIIKESYTTTGFAVTQAGEYVYSGYSMKYCFGQVFSGSSSYSSVSMSADEYEAVLNAYAEFLG